MKIFNFHASFSGLLVLFNYEGNHGTRKAPRSLFESLVPYYEISGYIYLQVNTKTDCLHQTAPQANQKFFYLALIAMWCVI